MSDLDEVEDLLRKLEPVLSARARKLWHLYLVSGSRLDRERNLELLRAIADRRAQKDYRRRIRLPPPLSEKLRGRYGIGTVVYPDGGYGGIGLRDDELTKHVLIVGMTGMGKTNLVCQLLREFVEAGKPFLLFDWKRSYRGLLHLGEFRDLRMVSIGTPSSRFTFNPLVPPPGTDPKNWLGLLVDVMSHAFFYGHGVEYFLRQGIDELYRRFRVYDGGTEYPTFKDVQALLAKQFVRGREMLWMGSVKRVLAALTEPSVLAKTLNVRNNDGLDQLMAGQVILEMDSLPNLEKTFLVEALLLWIYQWRKNQGRHDDFRHALVIEEAHHVLSGFKEAKLGQETIVESMVRMVREFGEGVVVVDQEPSKLSKSIIANTNCKICFNLGNGQDVKIMESSMGFYREEENSIDQLKVGHAILKLKSRFHEPLHVRVPLVSFYEDRIERGSGLIGTP